MYILEERLNFKDTMMSTVESYINLTKPRIVVLFALTGIVSIFTEAMEQLSILRILLITVALMLTAASANAFNMYTDQDIDKIMERTKNKRAIPLGIRTGRDALILGFTFAFLSSAIFIINFNIWAVFLSIFTIVFYAVIYSLYLKRITRHNTVLGGIAGAMAPLIASVASTASISALAWAMFFIILCWQPAHFWALAITLQEDYRKANIPMLPVVLGEAYTRKSILFYTLFLIPVSFSPYFIGKTSLFYPISLILFNGVYLFKTIRMLNIKEHAYCKHLFYTSIAYISCLFFSLALDAIFFRVS